MIEYNDFAYFIGNQDYTYPKTIVRSFNAPHAMYVDTQALSSYSVDIDFNNGGIGVTFNPNPTELPPTPSTPASTNTSPNGNRRRMNRFRWTASLSRNKRCCRRLVPG